MSEGLIRWLGDRQFQAFMMLLVSLVLVRTLDLIDGAQFMVGYLSLGAGYYGADLFKARQAA